MININRLAPLPVAERRLRPIYDSLDNGNNKKALQEAEKVLKKQPDLQCAKVLKGLALLRLGRENDCMEQLEAVKKESINEESVLQAMTICYREIHKPDLICEIYENASLKDPKNEDLLTHLFLSYVRVANYQKQQRVALSLSKLNPKNNYFFWTVMSLLLETTDSVKHILRFCLPPLSNHETWETYPDLKHDNMKLRLAEKILEKLMKEQKNESKIDKEQEVLVYLIVLEMQGHLKEALEVLQSPLRSKLETTLLEDKKTDILMKLGCWVEASLLLKNRIISSIDSWNHILFYFKCLFNSTKDLLDENRNKEMADVKVFIDSLQKQNHGGDECPKRGPYLAYLEFYCQLEHHGIGGEIILGDIITYLMKYMEVFGSKDCCLYDLRPYLKLLNVDQAKEFLSHVFALTSLGEKEYPKTKKQMNLHISNLELSRALGYLETMTVDQKINTVNTLFDYFIHTQHFNKDLPSTEPRSTDRYALLAIHTLYHLWADTEETSYLFEAIVICHFGLEFSPSNTQFKTLLLKFYHLLGSSEGAHSAYLHLDLKHMQLDTLGYLHVYPLLSSAHYSTAQTVITSTIKFFANNFKESAEHITYAYKYEAYSKIPEFIEIRERLNNSTHFLTVMVENMLLHIFLLPSYPPTLQVPTIIEANNLSEKIMWDKLQDNRDLNVLWDADPEERRLSSDAVLQTYNHDIAYLRLRSLTLKIIVSLVHIRSCELNDNYCENDAGYDSSSSNNSASFSEAKSSLTLLLKDLETHVEALKDNIPNSISKKYLAGPPESRLILFVLCNYFDLVINEIKMVLQFLPGDMGCKEKAEGHLKRIVLYFQEFFNSVSSESFANTDDMATKSLFIKLCSMYTELLSFSCNIQAVCASVVRKLKFILTKKSKKKKDVVLKVSEAQEDYDWKADIISKFVAAISDSASKLDMHIKSVEKSWNDKSKKSPRSYTMLNVSENEHRNKLLSLSELANKNIVQSYSYSLNQLSEILKQRLKYLSDNK